jgi:hypothetical protein
MLYDGVHKREIPVVRAIRKPTIMNISSIINVYKIISAKNLYPFKWIFILKYLLLKRRPLHVGETQLISQV